MSSATASSLALLLLLAAGAGAAGWPPPRSFFPILPWDPQHGWGKPGVERQHGLASIAECGFTMAGFVLPQDLPECERLGLQAIMFPAADNVGTLSREWHKLSDGEIDARVKAFVEACGTSDAILGYYIIDEPNASMFPALGKAVAAVQKYAPGKLAYINLFPNYATVGAPDTSQLGTATYTEYLERYVAEVKPQFISYDNYMTQVSGDMTNADVAARYWSNLMEVRRVALESGLPFWNIVSSNQIRPHTTVPSPANLLLQAYTTLAAGGAGVSWYTYYGRGYAYAPIDREDRKTPTWGYLQLVNRQLRTVGPLMNGLRSTGVYFTPDVPPSDLPRLPGRIVKAVGVQTPVMVGELADEAGVDYAMVVNASLKESARLLIDTEKAYAERAALSPESGEWMALDDQNSLQINPNSKAELAPGGEAYRNGLWLTAGQGMLLRFKG
jgi:hypothetical protein